MYCRFPFFLIALPCRLVLTRPINGDLQCPEGQFTGGNCSFECDPGYLLFGTRVLNCLSDGSWSDPPPSCQLLQCLEPFYLSPPNGFIRLPCLQDYNSVCEFGCFDGYNLTGSNRTVCDRDEIGSIEWTYGNSEMTTCESEWLKVGYTQGGGGRGGGGSGSKLQWRAKQ